VASYVGGEFVEGHGKPVEVRNAHDDSLMLSFPDADASMVATSDASASGKLSIRLSSWALRTSTGLPWPSTNS
ncbi:hypothetical protein QCD79_34180, partial [Pseudomonas quasicaspiana]|nr:hypothetical protein [Pseudomonas quasicaspiana]